MTKRFTYNVNKNCIECDGKFVAYLNSVDGFRIANKLTALAKENEQLKTVINRYEKYSNKKNDELNFRQLDILKLKEENEQLKCSNKDAWDLIQFIYNEIKEDGSMDFGRIKDLVELE